VTDVRGGTSTSEEEKKSNWQKASAIAMKNISTVIIFFHLMTFKGIEGPEKLLFLPL
jgi:hypothetical protein